MYAVLQSFGLNGLQGFGVAVEADVSGGVDAFSIVGLPDSAVRESADRVRAAVHNLHYRWPSGRVTVNLAPADVRKTGPVYDLPLLLSQAMQALQDWLRRRGASRGLNRALIAVLCITGGMTYAIGMMFLRPAANAAELAIRGGETYTVQGESYTAYQDAVPLSLEELTEAQTGFYSTRRTGDQTIFLSRHSVTQEPRLDAQNQDELPSLRYTVYSIFWPSLYEICKRDLLETGVLMEQYILYSYIPADPTPWGAEEVFQRLNNAGGLENEFLLCYDNILVTIEFSWMPTQEQMELAGRKLASPADFGIW